MLVEPDIGRHSLQCQENTFSASDYDSLDSHLSNKPGGSRLGHCPAEVHEGVEERNVGPAHQRVADPVVEGRQGRGSEEPDNFVKDKDTGENNVVVAWKALVLQSDNRSQVNLKKQL